jgi:ABC-type nitrate/sulfonate/bicarbonate transport systems, periplasmic components
MKLLSLLLPIFFVTHALAVEKITLALNWKAEPEFGGFYQAELDGEFKSRGLNVVIQEGGSGTPTVQMLANGKVDYAIVSAEEILISREKNPNNQVVGLFAVYQKSPYIIMTHAERNFKNLQDVFQSEGLLSVQSGLPYFQFLNKKFQPVKAKIVPYLGGVTNFIKDPKFSQQGFATTEPLSAEKAGQKVKSFLIADEGFNPYLVVVTATEKTLKEKPEQTKKLIEAVRAGWVSYQKSPTKANQYMSKLNKSLDFATFEKGAEIQRPLIDHPQALGTMTEASWKTLAEQLVSIGVLKTTKPVAGAFQNM